MKPKLLKVSCSFCGKEIECPEGMEDMEKHACFECFNGLDDRSREEAGRIHVDIPEDKVGEMMPDILMSYVMEEAFPMMWNEEKTKLKSMSRKELAEDVFAAGAAAMFEALMELEKETEEEEEFIMDILESGEEPGTEFIGG